MACVILDGSVPEQFRAVLPIVVPLQGQVKLPRLGRQFRYAAIAVTSWACS